MITVGDIINGLRGFDKDLRVDIEDDLDEVESLVFFERWISRPEGDSRGGLYCKSEKEAYTSKIWGDRDIEVEHVVCIRDADEE